ncbi:MAG: glycoside hydrolase family 2 protein [Oscillospiraceae bacterium]|nr:glycoside hydrolase family 2 protein [Oscillospiraceae bacterium]
MRASIGLNYGWEFTERWNDAFAAGEPVEGTVLADLPHSFCTTPLHYFSEECYQTVGGYRKLLQVPEDWAGKRVFLRIGAAAHRTEVFVDGKKLSEHRCGYTAFDTELTGCLSPGGTALLTVRVDSRESLNQPPFGFVIDYMTYGGIYREVSLELRDGTSIADVFPRTDLPDVLISGVTVDGPLRDGMALRQTLTDRESGAEVFRKSYPLRGAETKKRFLIPGIRPWSPDSPALYTLTTELLEDSAVLDRREDAVGFRRAEWKKDGFYLNGQKLKLVGLNRHQSYPYAGYAMPERMQKLDADILKREVGVNAVRTSHYPQSPHFIDRCDELGLLVFMEIPGWQHIGDEAWKDQAVENVRDMILQYRNHPSIILWGVRINESQDDDALYARTNALARKLDPGRCTGGVRALKKSRLLEDVYTYNDFSHDGSNLGCLAKRSVTSAPDRAYLITEYCGHMYPTKTYDSERHRLNHALRHAAVLDAVAGEEDIAGSFGWCMFDYNTHRDFGSGDRVCYHGVMDMFRNPKLAAAVYAARQDFTPVLEVSSSMDLGESPEGIRGRLFVFTNADEVRLYRNGVFLRAYTHADSPYRNMTFPPIEIDDFIGGQLEAREGMDPRQAELVKGLLNRAARYGLGETTPAMLKSAAELRTRWHMKTEDLFSLYGKYIGDWGNQATVYRFDAVRSGQVVKSVIRSTVEELRLTARADHTRLCAGNTYDAALVRIAVTDQNGAVLSFWNGSAAIGIEGPIALIGPPSAPIQGGLGGTYVRTVGRSGHAALTLSAPGTEPVKIPFEVICN